MPLDASPSVLLKPLTFITAFHEVRPVNPAYVERLRQKVRAIGVKPGDVRRIDDTNVPEVVEELAGLWPPETVPAGKPAASASRASTASSNCTA